MIVVLKFEHQKYLSDFEDELRREFEAELEELKKRHDDALRQQEQQVRAEVAHFLLPLHHHGNRFEKLVDKRPFEISSHTTT